MADNLPAPVASGNRGLVLNNLEDMYRFAKAIAAAPDMRPRSMDTPEKCLVAMQYGAELGMAPMQAISSIAVVNGRPSVYGEALLAIANNSGLIKEVKETFDGPDDDLEAVCTIIRKDGRVSVGRFSVSDAKAAGLWSPEDRVQKKNYKTGGTYEADNDSPWHKYPRRMLMWRARGFAYRDGVPEALRGLWFREEIEHERSMKDITPQPVGPPKGVDPLLAGSEKATTGLGESSPPRQSAPEAAPASADVPSSPPESSRVAVKGLERPATLSDYQVGGADPGPRTHAGALGRHESPNSPQGEDGKPWPDAPSDGREQAERKPDAAGPGGFQLTAPSADDLCLFLPDGSARTFKRTTRGADAFLRCMGETMHAMGDEDAVTFWDANVEIVNAIASIDNKHIQQQLSGVRALAEQAGVEDATKYVRAG